MNERVRFKGYVRVDRKPSRLAQLVESWLMLFCAALGHPGACLLLNAHGARGVPVLGLWPRLVNWALSASDDHEWVPTSIYPSTGR